MTDFEDEVRRVMVEHDDEAPREVDLLRGLERRRPDRRRWYAVAVAAAVALVVSVVWAVGPGEEDQQVVTAPPSPLSCPETYVGEAPWVPSKPAGDADRLVPQEAPDSALVCAYAGTNTAKVQSGWALSGQWSLTGGLDALAEELTWQPRKLPDQEILCTLVGGRQTNYLIGLTYDGQTIWVTATDEPNGCVGTSNGDFESSSTVGRDVTAAFKSRVWPEPRSLSCDSGSGRLGQETEMVPAGSTRLLICDWDPHEIRTGYASLVDALNELPTKQSTRGCSSSPAESAQTYKLVFGYPVGPPVALYIAEGCFPEVDNLSLQSERADSIRPIIDQLLAAN